MKIIITNSSPDPIYAQISRQIKGQIIGGELLAMAVAGEKPDPEGLIQRLLASGVTQGPSDK